MKENIIKTKSYDLAVGVLEVVKILVDRRENIMSKQLLKSGTSVGANVREAEHAESKADSIHKLSIAQKEINEALFWLELLKRTSYLEETEFDQTYPLALEVLKLLTSIIKFTKSSN